MYLYFMFLNPLSWRDSTPPTPTQHHRTAECEHEWNACILGSPENQHVPQQQYNITGSIPFQLNVPQGYVLLPQQSQHDPFEIRFPI